MTGRPLEPLEQLTTHEGEQDGRRPHGEHASTRGYCTGPKQASCGSHVSDFVPTDAHLRPQQCPWTTESQSLEEGNGMRPLYTLLLCLPAALALIACGCGVAVLWPSAARSADHPTVGRRHSKRHAA